ncbi:uncharacterized protein JCM10292_007100 [Rhodotorula paludigena]|uniref:uncharacterized protein n=1 Tax=Rhodotorula paludigena TaxID=86838 RepID=UPI0031752E7A
MFAFSRPPPPSHSSTRKASRAPAVRPAKPGVETFTRKFVNPAQPQASAGHKQAKTYLPTPSPAGSNRALSPIEVNGGENVDGVPIVVEEDDVVRPQEKKRKAEAESDSDSLSTADSVLASAATASASRRVVLFNRWTSLASGPGEPEDEDADADEEEDAEAAQKSASPQKKRRIGPRVRIHETKDVSTDDELFERSTSSAPVHVPGLPKASDTFASVTDAYSAYVKAIVPV